MTNSEELLEKIYEQLAEISAALKRKSPSTIEIKTYTQPEPERVVEAQKRLDAAKVNLRDVTREQDLARKEFDIWKERLAKARNVAALNWGTWR